MRKSFIALPMVLVLLAVNWLAFHDLFEPHTIRDYLTLVGSLLAFAYLVFDARFGKPYDQASQ